MQPWYLSYMIIHDLQTGEKFRFFADKWLAIDRDDFSSETQLPVSLVEGDVSFGYLFKQVLLLFSFGKTFTLFLFSVCSTF